MLAFRSYWAYYVISAQLGMCVIDPDGIIGFTTGVAGFASRTGVRDNGRVKNDINRYDIWCF